MRAETMFVPCDDRHPEGGAWAKLFGPAEVPEIRGLPLATAGTGLMTFTSHKGRWRSIERDG